MIIEANTIEDFKNAVIEKSPEIKVTNPDMVKHFISFNRAKKYINLIAALLGTAILISISTGGLAGPAALAIMAPVIFIVGRAGVVAMITLGVALGGITALKEFNKCYSVEQVNDGSIILRLKKE